MIWSFHYVATVFAIFYANFTNSILSAYFYINLNISSTNVNEFMSILLTGFAIDFQEIDSIFVTIECIFGSDINDSTFSESIILTENQTNLTEKMNRNGKNMCQQSKNHSDAWQTTWHTHIQTAFTLRLIHTAEHLDTSIQLNTVLWQNPNSNSLHATKVRFQVQHRL